MTEKIYMAFLRYFNNSHSPRIAQPLGTAYVTCVQSCGRISLLLDPNRAILAFHTLCRANRYPHYDDLLDLRSRSKDSHLPRSSLLVMMLDITSPSTLDE